MDAPLRLKVEKRFDGLGTREHGLADMPGREPVDAVDSAALNGDIPSSM